MKLSLMAPLLLLSACTYSINMVHSEGSASDVIDETQEPKADLEASIPASLVKGL